MPDWKVYVRKQLPALQVKPAREAEIIEELAIQLEQAYQEALRNGRDETEARRLAENQMPDWRSLALDIEIAQPPRHRSGARIWQDIPADLRHAFRVLRKSPVFTGVAIATLALGIGGCAAIFSLIEAVLLRPIAYREPDQLVMVWEHQYRRGFHKNVVAMADYLDWKARNHVFSDMSPILDQIWNVTGAGEPAVLQGISANHRFLPMLGAQPLLGRSFSPEEARAGGPPVALLSHRLWTTRFGARPDAIGKNIVLDDKPHTIIGVLPANFPWLGRPLDVLTPMQLPDRDWRVKAGRFLRVVARLEPRVSLAQAQNEMNAIARQLEVEYPEFNKDWGVEIIPLAEHFAADFGGALWILMGAVGLVLLIACSNVANLMLIRAVVREREMALRAALGATAQRLVRLLLVESAVLALIGGALGCAAAYAVIRAVQLYGPQDVARLQSAGLNFRVAIFALLVSLITGILFGLAPAIAARRLNLGAALREGGRGVGSTLRSERLRGAFVVAQVALALLLLTGAGLLMRSLNRLSSVPAGFDSHNVLTGSIMISGDMEAAKLSMMCREMVDRLRALPAVENAGFITWLPFTGMGAATGFNVVGRPPYAPGQTPVTDVRVVQPGYFETMRIPLLRGRFFTRADDRLNATRTFVVNEALAREMFGKDDPLSHSLTVQMGDDKPGQIIGVAGNTKQESLDGEVRPMVYYVQSQLPVGMGTFVVRTKSRPELLATAMEAAIHQVKKDQPVSDLRTMDDWIGRSIARMHFQTALLAGFALVALVLASIGVYGVMAYSVEQRTHEIGVRLALGADHRYIQHWIALRGMRLAALGLLIGLIAAAASTRVLHSLLYGVQPFDLATFALATAFLAVACLVASYLPARRAVAVDPVAALRGE